jgi:tetratricopeptide (TPR) repeat protein
MVKAFLSHSSKDKGIVGQIFKALGAAGTHYDAETFEHGETSASEIYRALSNTDVFVLFVSQASIDSKWVQSEIATAQQKIGGGRIKKILVFLLDDLDPNTLPEWIRDYVYRRMSSSKGIAESIRSALIDVALAAGSERSFFIGREKDLSDLKSALARVSSESPSVMFFSGFDGIGRRTLVKKAIAETYTNFSKIPLEIILGDAQGDVDFYRSIIDYYQDRTVSEIAELVREYIDKNPSDRAAVLAEEVAKVADERQIIFLRGHESVIRDDGGFQDWLGALIQLLPRKPRPQMALFARRIPPVTKRKNYPNTYFGVLQSLSHDDSRSLLILWLKSLEVEFPADLIDEMVPYVSGHPTHIEVAARYAAEVGSARVATNRAEFIDVIRQRADALIESIELSDQQEQVLALFKEYEYLSSTDLLTVLDVNDSELLACMAFLQDHGFIEKDGNYLKLAPYLVDAVSRHEWKSSGIKVFIDQARGKFLERVSVLSIDDVVEIQLVDKVVLAALRTNQNVDSNPILSGALLPSQMLRVSREFYDAGEYGRSAELARRALDRSQALTHEAQIEAYRLRGLSLVRQGKAEDFFACINEFEKRFKDRPAKRNAAFLRGFKARWDGKPDEAVEWYRKALELGGARNFHVLRELAQVLAARGDYEEAEKHARVALEVAPRNAFVLDNLLDILIERNRRDHYGLSNNPEIKRLLGLLEESARLAKRSFYESRMAHFCSILKKTDDALDWANRAVEVTPHLMQVYVARAKETLNKAGSCNAVRTLRILS